MKVAVLWTLLGSYLNACLRELSEIDDVKLLVANYEVSKAAPYKEKKFPWIETHLEWKERIDIQLLETTLAEFKPDVLLVSSWHIPEYRSILKDYAKKSFRVLAMDNQWLGTFKQWAGALTSGWYIQPYYDAVFLPGDRQVQFAKRLGFEDKNIIRGLLACDHDLFSSVFRERDKKLASLPPRFLYAGRLSVEKGIEPLIKGYQYYRSQSRNPWPLFCCGTGPLETSLKNVEGVVHKGFLQPEELSNEMKNAGCLVLPSYFEPWGVVIHEAVSAGLPVICSSCCGASVHLVQEGFNGYVISKGNPEELGRAMLHYERLSDIRKIEMGRNSFNLSLQFTPKRWALHFSEKIQQIKESQNNFL